MRWRTRCSRRCSEKNKATVARAPRIERSSSQPCLVAEQLTGYAGRSVERADTVAASRRSSTERAMVRTALRMRRHGGLSRILLGPGLVEVIDNVVRLFVAGAGASTRADAAREAVRFVEHAFVDLLTGPNAPQSDLPPGTPQSFRRARNP